MPFRKPGLNWISISHLQHFVARGQAAGLSMEDWLEDIGVSTEQLGDANRMIPVNAIEAMLETLTSRYELPLIGLHMAHDIQPAALGPLGQIAQVCNTFGTVVKMAERLHGLLSNIGDLRIIHHPGQVEICWDSLAGGPAFKRQAREYVLGSVAVIMRFLLPEQKRLLLRVNFSHERPQDPHHVRGYFTFFGVPVHFDQPHSSLVLPSALLEARMPHGNAAVRDLLEQHAARTIREREYQADLKNEVRQLIRVMLMDGPPTKEMVADQLGLSARHLHRQLQAQGSSYRDLLQEVRLILAADCLREQNMTVEDTARRLGFASRQAFLRWFRLSTNQTPTEFRQRSTAS